MQELKQSTEIKVRVGPAVDVADGFTPETGITLGAADEAELLKQNGVATVDISGNTWAAITNCDGWYDLTFTVTDTNTLGQLTVVIQDDSVCLPIFCHFMVVSANFWDSKFGSEHLDVNVVEVDDDTTAADNLELMFDGTGYAGGSTKLDVNVASEDNIDFGVTKKASINTECDTALTDYDPPTRAELTTDKNSIITEVNANETKIDTIDGIVDNILIDTGELQTDWVNGGRLDLLLDAVKAVTDALPDAGALTTIDGIVDSILADTGTDGVLLAATATSAQLVDDIWDEILTAAAHNVSTSAGRRLRELGSYHITSGTAQAGTAHSITLAAAESSTDHIFDRNLLVIFAGTGAGQTRTIVDYNGTSKIAVIDRNWWVNPDATSEYTILPDDTPLVADHGVATAGTSTTITIRASASAIDSTYSNSIIQIMAGTGQGQSRLIDTYVGSTKVVTICGTWTTTPDNTSVYVILPYGVSTVCNIETGALALINTECDTALTDYDPPTRTEATSDKDAIITEVNANETKIDTIDTVVDSILADTGTDGVVLTAGAVDAILDEVVEGTLTLRQAIRVFLSALGGKSSGGGTVTLVFRDTGDTKNRITATVDANGNRTAMTLDGS